MCALKYQKKLFWTLQTAKSLSVAMSTIFLSFANHTGKIVTPMDAVDLTNKNVDEAGALLFDYLERNLIDNHVALVHNVERLDGNVALNLHPFCDEASNFPKSLILFTIQNNLDDVHKRVKISAILQNIHQIFTQIYYFAEPISRVACRQVT